MKVLPNGIAVLESDTHISRWVESCGRLCHDGCVPLFILPLIPKDGWVVDGGAFIGDHTTAYLDKVGPNGTVFAFEPNPEAFECLKHNCPKARCLSVALGREPGCTFIARHPNAGASSLAADAGIPIEVVPLDSLELPRLHFMKLDLEGFEVQALRGASATLARCRPVMVIEMMNGHLERQGSSALELQELLTQLRYFYRPLNPTQSMNDPQVDIVCHPMP